MKKYEIVGVQENSGTIKATGKPWKNYEFLCVVEYDREIKGLTGKALESVKISTDVMKNFVDEVGKENVIGSVVTFEFERRVYNGVEKLVTTDVIPCD